MKLLAVLTAYALDHHLRGMSNGTYLLSQTVEVVKALVVALENGHILCPWRQDKQRATSTGLETAALWLPILAYGV